MLIESLTPSDEKLVVLEGKSVEALFQTYLARHLPSIVKKTDLLNDFMRYSRGSLKDLSGDTFTLISDFLPTEKDIKHLSTASTAMSGIFSSTANCRLLLTAVVQGNLEATKRLVARNPEVVFQIASHVTDPAGHTFYHLSAYQLMTFLCDADMKHQIMTLVAPHMTPQMKELQLSQYAELGIGGVDLVKLNQDPTTCPFSQITAFIDHTMHPAGTPLTISLLENPDGLIFYNDRIYYANQLTRTVTELDGKSSALASLKGLFADMENNSARRSSDKEHQLIQENLNHPKTSKPLMLIRQGIKYTRDKETYHDARIEFTLLNAYRKYCRLHSQSNRNNDWTSVENFWIKVIGGEQKNVIWLLQRFCEFGRPFNPVPVNTLPFKRGFEIENWSAGAIGNRILVFSRGCFFAGLGFTFAIYKGDRHRAYGADRAGRVEVWEDVRALIQLIKDGKARVADIKPTNEPQKGP